MSIAMTIGFGALLIVVGVFGWLVVMCGLALVGYYLANHPDTGGKNECRNEES